MHFPQTIPGGNTGEPPAASSRAIWKPGSRERGQTAVLAWAVPDLAMAGAMAAVLYLLLVFGGATALFRDSDAGWHIRLGERILTARALPVADPFSFSKAGNAWIAWEWLADVLVGGVHMLYGLGGVAFLYTMAIGASVWMWFRLNWAAGGNFLIACALASPLLSTVNLHWLARPHVLSWLLLLGAVWFCERMPERLDAPRLAAVALFSAVWANLHASFPLGPAIAVTYGVGAWLGAALWGESRRAAKVYLAAAAAALAGTLVNPYGWELHRHVLAYLGDSALLDRIGEFQSFNFHADGAAQIMVGVVAGLGGGFASLAARRPERFLLALLLIAGALRSARLLPVAALVLLPLANGSITAVLAKAQLAAGWRARLDAWLQYGKNLRALDGRMHGLVIAPLVALACFGAVMASRPGFPANQFPVGASHAIEQLPAGARLFAPDKFGGYLIYRFHGTRPVFFDGRSDFYGANFLRRYERLVQARPGWQTEFANWRFTHALLPPDYTLAAALAARGWTEIYRDRVSVLLAAPPTGEPQA